MTINLDKIKSRKLWTMIGVILMTALNSKLGLEIPEKTITEIIYLAMAYIGGQAVVDMKKGG